MAGSEGQAPRQGEGGYFFTDKNFSFGVSISCSHFQRFSNAVAAIFRYKTGKKSNNYLDDFLFTVLLSQACDNLVRKFLDICGHINFPIFIAKTCWSTQVIVFIGMLFNTVSQTISIPIEKRDKALMLLGSMLQAKKSKVTILKIQQLIGLLNFISRAVVPGKLFTKRMYNKLTIRNKKGESLKQHHHVRLDSEFNLDCIAWIQFLQNDQALARPFVNFKQMSLTATEINFFSDASRAYNLGFEVTFANEWCYHKWEPGFTANSQPSIEFLELYAVAIGVYLRSHKLRNRRVIIFCDNMGVVHLLNGSTSACKNCVMLQRLIVL